jgi:polyisoprenoid-binding protein YceI
MSMKRILLSTTALAFFFASCQNAPEADQAQTADAVEVTATDGPTHKADPANSKFEFIGTKPVAQHHGTIQLKDGQLTVSGDVITGGTFVFDLNTLVTDDQDNDDNAKLTGHLKSADFFDVENHPDATFEIVSVTAGVAESDDLIAKDATHTVTGNLTMKGVTKSITFPAKVEINDSQVSAQANFNIDRTQWGLVYGNDQSLGDKFIRPEVNIQLQLQAQKL